MKENVDECVEGHGGIGFIGSVAVLSLETRSGQTLEDGRGTENREFPLASVRVCRVQGKII